MWCVWAQVCPCSGVCVLVCVPVPAYSVGNPANPQSTGLAFPGWHSLPQSQAGPHARRDLWGSQAPQALEFPQNKSSYLRRWGQLRGLTRPSQLSPWGGLPRSEPLCPRTLSCLWTLAHSVTVLPSLTSRDPRASVRVSQVLRSLYPCSRWVMLTTNTPTDLGALPRRPAPRQPLLAQSQDPLSWPWPALMAQSWPLPGVGLIFLNHWLPPLWNGVIPTHWQELSRVSVAWDEL